MDLLNYLKMKYNIVLHVTTLCNYNCSYCDVIKDKQKISKKNIDNIFLFIKNNNLFINKFKFFWWEPLLAFDEIKYIINNTNSYIWNNYEIVTNTTILNDEIWEYFEKYFKLVFFSIDTENHFDYDKIIWFTNKYNIEKKLYFNLIINPWKEEESLIQFKKLYNLWFRWFNILPVYLTKSWSKENLECLSKIMKEILSLSLDDESLRLYWFQENLGENSSLINNTFFINTDNKLYYWDIVSTYFWSPIKKELLLWDIIDINLEKFKNYSFDREKEAISKLEENIYNKVVWQKQLHKVMDYFSIYLNKNNGK